MRTARPRASPVPRAVRRLQKSANLFLAPVNIIRRSIGVCSGSAVDGERQTNGVRAGQATRSISHEQ